MQKVVVILNGPPGCGKDTLAQALVGCNPHRAHVEFKAALYGAVAEHLYVDKWAFQQTAVDRELKEEPYGWLRLSPRQMMIYVSEQIIKPLYGDRYFGERALEVVRGSSADVLIFSDGGFASELEPLIEAGYRVLVVRLRRVGFSFAGDSRSYYALPVGAEECLVQVQEGAVAATAAAIESAMSSLRT